MSMDAIRSYYNVPAKRGARIKFCGEHGVITGTPRDGGMHLNIRMIDGWTAQRVHPTWRMDYLDGKGER